MKKHRKVLKLLFISLGLLIFTGCNSFFGSYTSSSGSTTTQNSDGTVTICDVASVTQGATTSVSSFARMSRRSKTVYNQVSESTIIISACYTVSNQEYLMMTSGFIIDKEAKDSETYTYYVTTSASGIFYRYIKSISPMGFDIEKDTTVVREGDFEFIMADGNRYMGLLVGFNDDIDVAVFKFDSPCDYEVLTWGDSQNLSIGDPVSSIGTPVLGSGTLFNTYVSGYVSGQNRLSSVKYQSTYNGTTYSADFLSLPSFQFDAPINGGMEGGPVLNAAGEVIGMNAYRYSESEGKYESLSFAIEGNIVKNVSQEIIEKGSYKKPVVGVTVTNFDSLLNYEWSATYGVTRGLYIVSELHGIASQDGVASGGAAEEAGMKSAEVIIKLNINGIEHEIINLASLSSLLYQIELSDTLIITTKDANGITKTYNLVTASLWK